MDFMPKTPNERLKRAREQRGWSQEYVADQIDAPDSTYISRWERGVVKPVPLYRERLCKLFEMNAEELGFIATKEIPLQQTIASSENQTDVAGTTEQEQASQQDSKTDKIVASSQLPASLITSSTSPSELGTS